MPLRAAFMVDMCVVCVARCRLSRLCLLGMGFGWTLAARRPKKQWYPTACVCQRGGGGGAEQPGLGTAKKGPRGSAYVCRWV